MLTSFLIYPGAKLFSKRLNKQWLSAEEVYGITGMVSCHVKTGAVIGMANHYTILLGLRAYGDGFEPYLGSQPEFHRETMMVVKNNLGTIYYVYNETAFK